MPTLLTLSGSLRADSANTTILRALAAEAPTGVDFVFYENLAFIPPFAPVPDETEPPAAVTDLRRQVAAADGVVVCTPEYAFGIPGALKNALDWTVGSGEFLGKPTALITASLIGDKAHQALAWVFEALGANVVPEGTLLISGVRQKLDPSGSVTDPATARALRAVLDALVAAVSNPAYPLKSKSRSEQR